jgi:guanylate kinase
MNTTDKGILVIVSGFSGAGKGTLIEHLMKEYPKEYALSISATTRGPRPGEKDGVHYFFRTRDEFEQMIQDGELLEYAEYVGNYYGTPKQYVLDQMEQGRNVLLEIEMQGAMKVKARFPETRLIFVSAPSAKVLYERLTGRGTEEPTVIAGRMARACEESEGMEEYDYLLINDDLAESTRTLHEIITNEKQQLSSRNILFRMDSHTAFVDHMRTELKSFSKGE